MRRQKQILWKIILCFVSIWFGMAGTNVLAAEKSFNQSANIRILENEDYLHTKQPVWISYRAASSGYITITLSSDSGSQSGAAGTICLYGAKKQKALSGADRYQTTGQSSFGSTVSYGVEKNKTYYIQLKAEGAVSVSCKFTKVKENSGSKKSKAKALTKKKTAAGILAAGKTTADWYKITIKKKQILHLYYSGKTNSRILFTFSGKYLKTAKRYIAHGNEKTQHSYSLERIQPGTYYVKVEPADKCSSGYYTIKWK